MTVTKRDFEMIAEAFRDAAAPLKSADVMGHPDRAARKALETAAAYIGDGLKQANPRFDFNRFYAACGFTA